MLEVLKFVLSDFWVFCGTVILIYVSGMSVSMIVAAAFGNDTGYSLINIGGKKKEKSEKRGGEGQCCINCFTRSTGENIGK